MTLDDLARYRDIMAKVAQDEEILTALRSKAAPASSRLDGLPHGSEIGDKTACIATEIAYMEAQMEQLRLQAEVERREVETYISTISDERVLIACRLRFLRCMSWDEVADMMGMYYSGSGLRRLVSRYLKTH